MLMSAQNICCDPSLGLPRRGGSNEGSQEAVLMRSQHTFSLTEIITDLSYDSF